MNIPSANEKLFQSWVSTHGPLLTNGAAQPKDLVLVYDSAYQDGWHQALSCARSIRRSVAEKVRASENQPFGPCPRKDPRRNQLPM